MSFNLIYLIVILLPYLPPSPFLHLLLFKAIGSAASAARASAATEMSVTLVSCSAQNWPDICVRSSLLCAHLPKGFKFYGKPTVDVSQGRAMLQAAYVDESNQIVLVRAWHRLCKDDGRGDIELSSQHDTSHPAKAV